MDDVLLSAPTWLLAVIMIGASAAISLVLTALARRAVVVEPGEHHNEVLGVLLSSVGMFSAVVVALAVFVVWDHQTSARQAEVDEGAALIGLYQEAASLPQPDRRQVRAAIRDYTSSEVNDEFPRLARREPSEGTERRLSQLNAIVHQRLGDTNAPNQMNDVVQAEYRLVLASATDMPPLLWVTLLGSLLVMLLMAAPLFMEHARHHAMGTIMLGCTIGAAVFLIFAADHPFAGPLQVHPTDLVQDLHMFSVIDSTTVPPGR